MARFVSLLLLLLPLLDSCAASARVGHTLGAGSSLSVEDHDRPFLVSPDGTFSCGFLPAGKNAFYFSVWFTAATDRTAVWTANPGAPVNGRVSRVSFGDGGKLALADANGTTVWDSKNAGSKHFTVSLLDTGNLLVAHPSSGRAVWQSFDWPTDTLLPSQPLTKDTRLVAGYYSLYYDNDNVLRLLYDGPQIASIYWPDRDIGVFGSGRTNYNNSRIGVLDDTGVFLSSDNLRVEASDLGAAGVKRRLTIEQDGSVRMYSLDAAGGWTVTWAAVKQPCSVHGLCGKNAVCEYQPSLRCSCVPGYEMVDRRDWRKGCKPTFSLPAANCSASSEKRFTFVKVASTDFYGYDVGYNSSVTFEYCKSICLRMCSCAAFAYKKDGTGQCYPKGVLFNGYTSPTAPGNIYLKVPSDLNAEAPPPSMALDCTLNGSDAAIDPPTYVDTYGALRSGPNLSYLFWFAAVLGFLELLFAATAWWFMSGQESMPSSLEAGYRLVMGTQFRRFTYRELKKVTGDFNEVLGRGGSGVVYRGVLDKTTVVAVKELTNVVQGEEEFWAEMTVFGRINHINLVRIWGFCSEGKHKLLVYEYVENGSLDRHRVRRGQQQGAGMERAVQDCAGRGQGPSLPPPRVPRVGHPLRRQAGEHPAHPRPRPKDRRLRAVQAVREESRRRRRAALPDEGNDGVHGTRVGVGPTDRRQGRRVQLWCCASRDPDGKQDNSTEDCGRQGAATDEPDCAGAEAGGGERRHHVIGGWQAERAVQPSTGHGNAEDLLVVHHGGEEQQAGYG
ncbi:hypothetical protein ACQJBY_003663 [Aegilops geniculata]